MNRWKWHWDPSPWTEIQVAINDMLDELSTVATPQEAFPRTELERTPSGFQLVAAVPGLKREEITLSIAGNALTIEGERRRPELEGAELIRGERVTGSFRKTVEIPEAFDAAGVHARLADGLLTIELPYGRPDEQRVPIDVEEV